MITYADSVSVDFGVPWPDYDKIDPDKLAPEELQRLYRERLQIEKRAKEDPIKFGWTLKSWREVLDNWPKYSTHVILGGNRASKSKFIASLFVQLLIIIPEARLRMFHVSTAKSITEQQAYIWEALPQRYKDLSNRKSGSFSTSFSQRNGFVGDKLILPPQDGYTRGSELIFGTYSQYRNDPQVIEGWWAHAIACDEEVPQKMFERLLTRIYDVRGRMVLGFTTIQGWTGLIADLLGKTKVLRRRYSQLLKREIKVAEESLTRPGTRIYYFWTEDNPFIPPETIERMRGRPEAEILAVAHGIPTRSQTSPLPDFDESVHVVADEILPWKRTDEFKRPRTDFTVYQVIDPAGRKPWFAIWCAVDKAGTHWIFRDWPDVGYGSWGELSEKPEGSPGPAQKPNSFGIGEYVETFQQLEEEDGFEVFERIIDPRMGASTVVTRAGAVTIISELEDAGMLVVPAPGRDEIEDGIALIKTAMSFDRSRAPDSLNAPKLFISSNCENLIACIKNYTGCSRLEVWKDGVDTVRYLLSSGCVYVEPSDLKDGGRTFSY